MEHTHIPREVYVQASQMVQEPRTRELLQYIADNWGTQYAEFQFQLHHCSVIAMEINASAGSMAKGIAPICEN